jgi:hypothetical protein
LERELVSLRLGIGPKHVMTHFVINGVNPATLAVVFSAALPTLRMDKVDLSVLVSLSRSFTPVEILKPLYLGMLEVVKATNDRNSLFKVQWLIFAEE